MLNTEHDFFYNINRYIRTRLYLYKDQFLDLLGSLKVDNSKDVGRQRGEGQNLNLNLNSVKTCSFKLAHLHIYQVGTKQKLNNYSSKKKTTKMNWYTLTMK